MMKTGMSDAVRLLGMCLFIALPGAAQPPSFVGASACAGCHPAEFATQSASAHAQALSRPANHSLVRSFPFGKEFTRSQYHFRFDHSRTRITVHAEGGGNALDLPADWAFGAGRQAVTFLGRLGPDWYLEHFFSWYSETGSFEPTPGQFGLRSQSLDEAVGIRYRSIDPVIGAIKCMECHSTGTPLVSAINEITPAEAGVHCERCHGPGSLHIAAAARGDKSAARAAVSNPNRLSPKDLNQFCGACHRAPEGSLDVNWYKPWSVRYQPIYLARSECFLRSQGKLSCLTCHGPHENAKNDAPYYDARCAGCHDAAKHPAHEPGTCIGCHMPRVNAQLHLNFTNHWIGIYDKSNPLMPRGQGPL
jgi:hypothetical protein